MEYNFDPCFLLQLPNHGVVIFRLDGSELWSLICDHKLRSYRILIWIFRAMLIIYQLHFIN